jgi:DNA-binding transcriptional regulator YhcF (GntR family)
VADEPLYLRIAGDLRRRIAAGELAPGDRLPSTRALAAERGVAPATAAKALEELRRAGVVRAQPRVGTIVAPPPPSRRARTRVASEPAGPAAEADLTRERLVRAAMEIADTQGLDAVSMRTVAARLGVPTMSLYRHVAGKDNLVLLMADAAYGEAAGPEPAATGWREQVRESARALWALYRRHPWLAHLGPLARPLLLPNLMRHGEQLLGALAGLGLPPARVLDVQIMLFSHGQGLAVNLEREASAQASTGLSDEQWVDDQGPALRALADSGDFPHFAAMLAGLGAGYDFDLDALFETGLQALLDGIERLVVRETGG